MFGLGEPICGLKYPREIAQCHRVSRVTRTVPGLHRLGVALGKRNGLSILACGVELDHMAIECIELGIGLRRAWARGAANPKVRLDSCPGTWQSPLGEVGRS